MVAARITKEEIVLDRTAEYPVVCRADTPISQNVEIARESVREHRDVGVHQPLRGGGDGGT